MKLKIGDVSRGLGISTETIRYYESSHIIAPKRKDENAYRTFDAEDVLYLLDCMKYRSCGFSVKDVATTLHSESLSFFLRKLRDVTGQLKNEAESRMMLANYVSQYLEVIETAELNQDRLWAKKIQEQCYVVVADCHTDHTAVDMENPLFKQWLKYLPYVSFTRIFPTSPERFTSPESLFQEGAFVIEKRLMEALNMPKNDMVHSLPERYCLCTVINVEKSEDIQTCIYQIVRDVLDDGYKIYSDICARILLRTYKNGTPRRYLEVEIPIKVDA